MKLKGKQEIEYWITRGRSGQLIRVYQVDQPLGDPDDKNPFTVPILVDYMGQGESIADLLEERDQLRKEKRELTEQIRNGTDSKLDAIWQRIEWLEKKRPWWRRLLHR